MKKFKSIINAIYWFFYKLTPRGKKAYILMQGFKGIQQSKAEGNITKLDIIGFANKLLKPKKILTFHKGNSISKSKKSNFEVIKTSKEANKDQLKERGLKITKKGTFKHA